ETPTCVSALWQNTRPSAPAQLPRAVDSPGDMAPSRRLGHDQPDHWRIGPRRPLRSRTRRCRSMAHGGGSGVARCGRLRYGGKHLVPADHGSKEAIMPVNRRECLHRLAGGVTDGLMDSATLALAAS